MCRTQYAYYPQSLYSIDPVGGSFFDSTSVTVSGFFFPGFDGLSGSARCKFGNQLSTPTVLEAKSGLIVCDSPVRPNSPARSEAGGVGFEDVDFSVALNTVDFVGNENVTFRYYDHFLASISPRGGHLQGNTVVVISGDRFSLLTAINSASASLVRCRFGYHAAVQGELFTDGQGLVYIRCASSSSENFGRTETGYEFVSVSINSQNFLPALDGPNGCILNPDSCAQFKYYTQNVFSLWPVAGPAAGGSQLTIAGEFSPGYDGVRTSANCLFRSDGLGSTGVTRRTSTVQRLEATTVSCLSTNTGGLTDASDLTGRLLTSEIGVALNGAYVQDDSSDYKGVLNVCPANTFSSFQSLLQYRQSVQSITPTGGPVDGGTEVTVLGSGFVPVEVPHLTPALLRPSARCLWGCTSRPDNTERCIEGGVTYESQLTRPVSVTPTEIVCPTPEYGSATDAMFGLALNVYDAVTATCDDQLQNGDETGVDCGGTQCTPCVPSCVDGQRNGDETGVDCGGSSCAFCVPTCSEPNSQTQDCLLATLSSVTPTAGPTEHATMLTVRGTGFHQAGSIITYDKVVLGTTRTYTHTAQPRCSFGYAQGDQRTTVATILDSSSLQCLTPRAALVGCYTLQISLDICDYHDSVQAGCPAAKIAGGLPFTFVPKALYPGYSSGGNPYSYEGDFVMSGQKFRFFEHAAPAFTVRAAGLFLGATEADGSRVAAGGPLQGGTVLTISYSRSLVEQRRRAQEGSNAAVPSDELQPPFFRLDDDVTTVLNQSLCGFGAADGLGAPPYTRPLNVTGDTIVCVAPPRATAATVPLRVSLNGQQFFATGLAYQFFEHPNISAIYPQGGLVTGATPVTVYGSGFRNFVPDLGIQQCSWGVSPAGKRLTTLAKYNDVNQTMVCLSHLRREATLGAGMVAFSLSLNGIDYISEATVE